MPSSAAKRIILSGRGPNLVVNGGFDVDANWTKQAGWTISAGAARFTATGSNSFIFQNVGLVIGGMYRVTFDLTVDAGAVTLFTGTLTSVATYTETGSYVGIGRASSDSVLFAALTTFTGTLDNVSVRRV